MVLDYQIKSAILHIFRKGLKIYFHGWVGGWPGGWVVGWLGGRVCGWVDQLRLRLSQLPTWSWSWLKLSLAITIFYHLIKLICIFFTRLTWEIEVEEKVLFCRKLKTVPSHGSFKLWSHNVFSPGRRCLVVKLMQPMWLGATALLTTATWPHPATHCRACSRSWDSSSSRLFNNP